MKHALKQKVFYSDTDAYGVAWHGSYLRWLEMGRVEMCNATGYTISQLQDKNIVLPVAEINIKYKNSAKIDDIILINTEISETSRCSMTFHQTITDESKEKTYVEATVKVVAIDTSGKLYRSLPEPLKRLFS